MSENKDNFGLPVLMLDIVRLRIQIKIAELVTETSCFNSKYSKHSMQYYLSTYYHK